MPTYYNVLLLFDHYSAQGARARPCSLNPAPGGSHGEGVGEDLVSQMHVGKPSEGHGETFPHFPMRLHCSGAAHSLLCRSLVPALMVLQVIWFLLATVPLFLKYFHESFCTELRHRRANCKLEFHTVSLNDTEPLREPH